MASSLKFFLIQPSSHGHQFVGSLEAGSLPTQDSEGVLLSVRAESSFVSVTAPPFLFEGVIEAPVPFRPPDHLSNCLVISLKCNQFLQKELADGGYGARLIIHARL